MNNKNNVQVNQIWQDWDIRFRCAKPKLIKVISIKKNFANWKNNNNKIRSF